MVKVKKTFLKEVKKEDRNLYSKAIEKGETVKTTVTTKEQPKKDNKKKEKN